MATTIETHRGGELRPALRATAHYTLNTLGDVMRRQPEHTAAQYRELGYAARQLAEAFELLSLLHPQTQDG